jgi:hypothetical protein
VTKNNPKKQEQKQKKNASIAQIKINFIVSYKKKGITIFFYFLACLVSVFIAQTTKHFFFAVITIIVCIIKLCCLIDDNYFGNLKFGRFLFNPIKKIIF